jgi:beta-lactamase regulating signal transducer with metallopeptidase domain
MMQMALWNESSYQLWTAALVNHIWQSTVVALIVWLLVPTLRHNHARTRYWVWMIASAKFLVPFSLLIAAGERLQPVTRSSIHGPAFASVMEQLTLSFPQAQFLPPAPPGTGSRHADILLPLLFALWALGALAVAVSWARKWRQVRAAVRAASPRAFAAGVPVLASSSLLEPGVFGILRPVLFVPEGILDRLTSAQLDAIVAHEMCHVRRRDNLTFTMHMVVETLFWFHPLVWWIGRV